MTDERWPRVKALFQAAVERPPAERADFLAAATGGDAALRQEVESLLASDGADLSVLNRLPVASASVLAGPLAALPSSMGSRPTLTAGVRIGPYEIVAPLGAGSMGEVYRARDTKLNRDVALKVLPELFALDANESGRHEVYVQPYPGPGERHVISTNGGEQPAWSANGQELFYVQGGPFNPRAGVPMLMSVTVATTPDFQAGTPETLFRKR